MKRLIPIVFLGPLLLGGTALAQSFEPPSFEPPSISDFPGVDIPQIDPPSLDLSTGPSDDEIASGISEALITTAAGISEGLDPDGGEDDPFAGISKMLHDTAMAIIRKIGG